MTEREIAPTFHEISPSYLNERRMASDFRILASALHFLKISQQQTSKQEVYLVTDDRNLQVFERVPLIVLTLLSLNPSFLNT